MINVVFILLAKGAFCDAIEGLHSKKFSFAPLGCSSPPSFHKNNFIHLWLIIFTIPCTIRAKTSVYPPTEIFPLFVLLNEMLLATSDRISQAATVRIIL